MSWYCLTQLHSKAMQIVAIILSSLTVVAIQGIQLDQNSNISIPALTWVFFENPPPPPPNLFLQSLYF